MNGIDLVGNLNGGVEDFRSVHHMSREGCMGVGVLFVSVSFLIIHVQKKKKKERKKREE